ncbi:MAG: TetR/AcrR family transcriptional regulator [Rhodothermales bacterium]
MVDSSHEQTGHRSSEAAVLAAAERVFVERGYNGARMQEIADAAGINKAMLHYYFRSKEKLFRTVFGGILNRTLPPLVEALGSELPLGLKIRRFIESYIDALERTPTLPAFILGELNRDASYFDEVIREAAAPIIPVLERQIQEAASAGRIKFVAAHDLLTTLLSLCIFPFVARPFLSAVFGMDDDSYRKFLDSRKATVTSFVFSSLQPES